MLAGIGAGLATGFAGLSAAVIISPILIGIVGVGSYEAVGIALASDVLASAASSFTYYRNKNINIKNGAFMMVSAVLFSFAGSLLGSLVHNRFDVLMEYVPIAITLALGIRFLMHHDKESKPIFHFEGAVTRAIVSFVGGSLIGLCCGTVGAGGGMMILIMLTMVLGYDLKTAVGTSVFIMTAVALTGAVSHVAFSAETMFSLYWHELLVCILFTLLGAEVAALIANKINHKQMNIITGVMLLLIGLATLAGVFFGWNVSV